MTDFRQGLRPKVLTRRLGDLGILHVISCSDEHIVLGIRHYGSIPVVGLGASETIVYEKGDQKPDSKTDQRHAPRHCAPQAAP